MGKKDKVTADNPFAENEEKIDSVNNADECEITEDKSDENTEMKEDVETSENKEKKKGMFDNLFGKEEISKLQAENDELKNRYLRLAADFENFRKRQATERESLIKFGMEEMFKKMIEILDNFERAEKAFGENDNPENIRDAFNVLYKQFAESLKKLGLEEINAQGQKFDPNLHEAVMQTPSDEHDEDTIIAELQKGYKYADKVIRPSMVNVSVKQG